MLLLAAFLLVLEHFPRALPALLPLGVLWVNLHGIEYPVLLAGLPSAAPAALPQVEHLDAFPTTLFLGRDGRLRATHAGFPSAASGAFYTQAREEITATVERLLLESGTE